MRKPFSKSGDEYHLFTEVDGVSIQAMISQEAFDLFTNEWNVNWVKRGLTRKIETRLEEMLEPTASRAKARGISPLLVSIAGYNLVHGQEDLLCFTQDGEEVRL